MMSAPLLADSIPELAREIEGLLVEQGEHRLAAQVARLRIVDRCRCGDPFCATFYTAPRPQGSWGAGHRNIELACKTGMLTLDVVNENVTCVEVLFRDEIRQKLHEVLP